MDFKINLDLSQVIHITAPEHDNDVVSISSKTYVFDNDAKISLIIQKTPGSSKVIRQLTVGNGLEVVEGALQIRFEGGKLQNGRYYYEAFDVELGKRIFRGWLHLLPSTYHFAVSHEENAFNGGKSAYKHWLDAGNSGHLADFLEAIKGEKGDQPSVEWNGTSLRIENPDGSWSPYVDLKGEAGETGSKGETGDTGPKGETGETGSKGDVLLFSALSETEKNSLKGKQGDQGIQGEQGVQGDKLLFSDLTEVQKNELKAKNIVLTQDAYDALNGVYEANTPYFIIE